MKNENGEQVKSFVFVPFNPLQFGDIAFAKGYALSNGRARIVRYICPCCFCNMETVWLYPDTEMLFVSGCCKNPIKFMPGC